MPLLFGAGWVRIPIPVSILVSVPISFTNLGRHVEGNAAKKLLCGGSRKCLGLVRVNVLSVVDYENFS